MSIKHTHKPHYRHGINVGKTVAQIHHENKTMSKDTKNRRYIIEKTVKLIKSGLTEEQILDSIMQDEVVREFDYLSKQGVDIRNMIKQWIIISQKNISKGEERE